MNLESQKGRLSIKNAVKQGVIAGFMGWAAIEGVQAYQPNAHQIFAERGAHTQFYSGDVGFGTHTDRPNTVDVTYRGRSVAAIPASSFGQPQSGEHNARRGDRRSAQHMRAERTSEPSRTQAADYGAPSYVHIDSMPNVSATVVAPVILESSTPAPIPQIPPWLPFVALAPEAIYSVGTTLNKTLIHSGGLQSRLNSFEALSLEARLLAACAVPLATIAPTESQQAPLTATAAPEVTGTPLVNEVLTSTPAPRIEVPVGSGEYPTAVSAVESPKVYSYGGPEGRENMDKITRPMFDRYIAELAREGKIQGSTPEALYLDFDKKYDFKMFVTDEMLTRLIQGKSGGEFLVPENMDGQVYRDLQLSYNDLFQDGTPVPVGTDDFNFVEYEADRIGGVGPWPVFVNVDDQSIPVSWLNVERGGAETSIQVASTVVTATSEAPPTPSGITVEIGGETITVNTTVIHSEATKNLNIDPAKVQMSESTDPAIGKIYWVLDEATNTRYLWHEAKGFWVPDITLSQEWLSPQSSMFVERSAVDDGSADLAANLYAIEHSDLIPPGAVDPRYKINAYGSGFELGYFRDNQQLWPDRKDPSKETQLIPKKFNEQRPFGWEGMFRTKDAKGNDIYVFVQHRKNSPTTDNPRKTMNIFYGFDKSAYENAYLIIDGQGNPFIVDYIDNNYSEFVLVFPPPVGVGGFDSNGFNYKDEEKNPNVARFLNQNLYRLFTPQEQEAIIHAFEIYNAASNKFSMPDQSFSAEISTLPPELSNMIVYPGIKGWTNP